MLSASPECCKIFAGASSCSFTGPTPESLRTSGIHSPIGAFDIERSIPIFCGDHSAESKAGYMAPEGKTVGGQVSPFPGSNDKGPKRRDATSKTQRFARWKNREEQYPQEDHLYRSDRPAQMGATFFAPAPLAASHRGCQLLQARFGAGISHQRDYHAQVSNFCLQPETLRHQVPSVANRAVVLRAQFALADDYVDRRSRAPDTVFEFAAPSSHDAWDRHGISIGPIRDPLSDLKLVKGHPGLRRRRLAGISECKT